MPYRLGIDVGTTNIVATAAVDGAPPQLVGLGAATPQTRSMLYLTPDGHFLVGDPAGARGSADPTRLITDPRRRLGTDQTMIINGQEVTPEQATTVVLEFVRDRATAELGGPPAETVLTYPARWNEYQIECFDRAIAAANLGPVRRVSEAEAAATGYAARSPIPAGARVAVYDLGGGSCEVTVLVREPDGMRAIGNGEGSDHPSGADFDEAVFRLVVGGLGDRGRELTKDDVDAKARLAVIRRLCTQAKEDLSTAVEAAVTVELPGFSTTVRLSRREFESLIRPAIRDTIALANRALAAADVATKDLAAVVLVGGCCRMPIVPELLQRELEAPIALGAHPEYDVAFGALLAVPFGMVAATPAPALIVEPPTVTPPTEEVPATVITAPALITPALITPALITPALIAPVQSASATVITAPTTGITASTAVITAPVPPAPAASPASPGDATVLSDQPIVWVPADVPTSPLTADHASPLPGPVPGAVPSASLPEQTMPEHLIFDYFPRATEAERTVPDPPAYAAAMASSPYPPGQQPPGGPQPRPGQGAPGQYPPNQYPPNQYPPNQYPQGQPTPSQRPPGQRPPGRRAAPPGYGPGPQTQPYGGRGPGGPGGYPPGPGGQGSGGGNRKRLILIIAGAVVLIGAAVGIGVFVSRGGTPVANPSAPPTVFQQPPVSTTPSPVTSPAGSATPTATPTPGGGTSSTPGGGSTSTTTTKQDLPKAAPIPANVVVVPMRRSGSDRPLYLVDTDGKFNRVKLPTPEDGNSNPMMQPSRDTIIYLNSGVLRVMGSDGSGDRKLFDRDPAGCDSVVHASWSLSDPNVMLISCMVSKKKDALLVIGMDGRLIRRLDTGTKVLGDFGISPDGQTVLYWGSDVAGLDGGALYTLPLIGTGSPKALTDSAPGVDADPAWSPDSTQIAFRRRVDDGSATGNYNVFVMNVDGSGARPVATTSASDFKPIWSPDNKNLLIISNRKSTFGGPGKTYDLWLTRVSDGEVLTSLGLKAKMITRPFWTIR